MIELLGIIACVVIFALVVWWLVKQCELSPVAMKIANIVVVVVIAVLAIGIILHFTGHGNLLWLPR